MMPRVRLAFGAAIAMLAAGFGCVVLSLRWSKFEPCHVEYRIHNAMQDSQLCRIDSILALAGLAMLSIAAVATVAIFFWHVRINRQHRGTPVT